MLNWVCVKIVGFPVNQGENGTRNKRKEHQVNKLTFCVSEDPTFIQTLLELHDRFKGLRPQDGLCRAFPLLVMSMASE